MLEKLSVTASTHTTNVALASIHTFLSLPYLHRTITPINHNIRSRGITRRIRREIQISALQLVSLALAPHGNLAVPDPLGLWRDEIADLGGHITWRDAVGTGEANPFYGKRFAEVDHACFGGVVLWYGTLAKEAVLHQRVGALTADWSCGMLAICPLIDAVATKLP